MCRNLARETGEHCLNQDSQDLRIGRIEDGKTGGL